jgi:NADPH:quinone reductase-like Zn-dependent oxidoreductase
MPVAASQHAARPFLFGVAARDFQAASPHVRPGDIDDADVRDVCAANSTNDTIVFVKPEVLQSLAQILEQPGITPAVDRTFQLEDAADGMRALISNQVRGKLVLRVSA